MKRAQIQFPEPLYLELKRIAYRFDWSLAEVVRRASENFAARFPDDGEIGRTWSFPVFDDMGDFLADPARVHPEAEAIESREGLK